MKSQRDRKGSDKQRKEAKASSNLPSRKQPPSSNARSGQDQGDHGKHMRDGQPQQEQQGQGSNEGQRERLIHERNRNSGGA